MVLNDLSIIYMSIYDFLLFLFFICKNNRLFIHCLKSKKDGIGDNNNYTV